MRRYSASSYTTLQIQLSAPARLPSAAQMTTDGSAPGPHHDKDLQAVAISSAREASSLATLLLDVTTTSACRWSNACRVASFHCERDEANARSSARVNSCAPNAWG